MKNSETISHIHNPHDKLFFGAMRNINMAKDAARAYIPNKILIHLDFTKMKSHKTKLVSPQLKEFQADVLYEIPFKGKKALLLFHCEQESKPNRLITLKIWQYLCLAFNEHAENHPNEPLPAPFSLVLYTGEARFYHSTHFFDLFGENKQLAEQFFTQGVTLVDVCRLEDEEIKKHPLFGLTELAFKYKKRKNFKGFLEIAIPWLHRVGLKIGDDYVKLYVQYMLDVFSEGSYDIFVKMTAEYHAKQLGEKTMTMAQQLRAEGREQGMQQGMTIAQQWKQEGLEQGLHQGMQQVAKTLLISKLPKSLIAKATGLSLEEIENIEKTLEVITH